MATENPSGLENIINGTISNVLATLVIFVLSLVFLDRKRIWAPWIYKNFSKHGRVVINCLIFLVKILIDPVFRVILAGAFLSLMILDYKSINAIYAIFIFLILLSFLRKPIKKNFFISSPKISDGFEKLNFDIWEIKTGSPIIEVNSGRPAPDLGLSVFPEGRTNSFIFLKNEKIEEGVIECDFYLEENALLNIVIFADMDQDAWYMARFDSRPKYSDGFIIKKHGENWKDFRMSGTKTRPKEWHRARVEFNSTRVSMYIGNNLIVDFENPTIFGDKVGIFNEVNFVHVDNFLLTK